MEICNFEIAVKLKEKGFRKPCILYYNSDKVRTWFNEPDIAKNFIPTTLGNDDVLAPTISQVLKWLREEKFILIGLSPMQEYDGDEMIEWCSTIYKADKQGGMSWMEELYYESYEQAALAGIEYVLNNLI